MAVRGLGVSLCTFLVGLGLLGPAALAGNPVRVVVEGPAETDATVVRLRRELALLGIEAMFVPTPAGGTRDLAALARDENASGAVAVELQPPALVVWIDPAAAPDAAGPGIRVDETLTGTGDPRVLVLRAVEILRERLAAGPVPARQPVVRADAGTVDAAVPPAAEDAGARPETSAVTRDLSAFLEPAGVVSPGGLAATAHVWLGLRWAPRSLVDLELVAFVPVTGANVSATEGSMSLRAGSVAAGAGVRLLDPPGRFFATAGAGLGVMLASFEGQARAPFQAESGLRALMLPYAHLAAGYWLVPRFALRVDVMTGFALPQPVLTIAGQKVADFGDPTALFAAGIEVRP